LRLCKDAMLIMLTKKIAIIIDIVHKNLNASKSQFVSFQYPVVHALGYRRQSYWTLEVVACKAHD